MVVQMHSGPFVYTGNCDQRHFDRGEELFFSDRSERLQKIRGGVMSEGQLEPHENDVLMGRGGKNNQHSGNEILRQFARAQCENYRRASKKGKSSISRYLVKQMRDLDPPARFLKKNTDTGVWEDVGDDTAREKASQVLRDAVAALLESEPASDVVVEQSFPPPTLSSSHSMDDYEHRTAVHMPTPGLASVASSSFPPPASPSRKRRRRYSSEPSTRALGIPDVYQAPDVYSPIRRHSHEAPALHPRLSERPGPVTRRSSMLAARGVVEGQEQMNEFDLYYGELLESDDEEGKAEPLSPGAHRHLFE